MRETHGSAAPQVVQGQLLLRLKQEGKSVQEYINKWQQIYAQLPEPMPMEYQKLTFVEGLNNKFYDYANEFRLRHRDCTVYDIMVYLRSLHLGGRASGAAWTPKKEAKGDAMDIDLRSLKEELTGLHKLVTKLVPTDTEHLNRLTAEQVQEYKRKGLCFECGKPGHMQATCNKRKNGRKGA